MELNKNNIKKILLIIAAAIALFCIGQQIEAVFSGIRIVFGLLSPLIIGLALAFIINVPMSAIERSLFRNKKNRKWIRLIKRPASLVITVLLILAAIAVISFLIIPELTRTFGILSSALPAFFNELEEWAKQFSDSIPELDDWIANLKVDWEQIGSTIVAFLQNGGGNMLLSTFNAATSIFSGIVNAVIGIVFACYILIQKELLGRQVKHFLYAYLPETAADKTLRVCSLSAKMFSNFLSGQCVEAVILGTLCFIGMSIFRFPYAMMISVMVGFLAIIPMFGAYIGVALGAFIILMVSPVQAFWFIIFFIVLQQIEGNLIYPKVVGSSVGLPAVWVLFAVTVGANTMGIVGMLIMIPICSVIYTLLGENIFKRLRTKIRRKKLDADKLKAPKSSRDISPSQKK